MSSTLLAIALLLSGVTMTLGRAAAAESPRLVDLHTEHTLSNPARNLTRPSQVGQVEDSGAGAGPYALQVNEQVTKLSHPTPSVRARAAEALGMLRAYDAESALIIRLADPAPEVRRQAALALAWCGGRSAVTPLIQQLEDADWSTRQAAHVALCNLTGMEFPFDALANHAERHTQIKRWQDWWQQVPADRPSPDVLALLGTPAPSALDWRVTVSSVYRGPAEVLIDGELEPGFWQTKNVSFPQWCQIDLGAPVDLKQVTVHQYGRGFCLTNYAVETSVDEKQFERLVHGKGTTPVEWKLTFPARKARYVRITSFGSENATYPTTFREIEINGRRLRGMDPSLAWSRERGLRALGALGGRGATDLILACLGPRPPERPELRPMVRAGIRALGRLREEAGGQYLIKVLQNPMWARCAAEALGDVGHSDAVAPLLAAYARFAKRLDGSDPVDVPPDDKMSFPSEDRMLETPYWIAHALSRLPLDDPRDHAALRQLAPRIMANLPGDHDTFMLYEPEAGHWLTRYLLAQAGLRQEAAEQAFAQLGQPRRSPNSDPSLNWPVFEPRRMATWLPAVCTDPADLPRLLLLLQHTNGWVRLNAAKTIGWLADPRATTPLTEMLNQAKAEADYGFSPLFKDEEFNDPSPRWREGVIRALGLLQATQAVARITEILNDEGSVLEVRHAAAQALADIGSPTALKVLRRAAVDHAFGTIRHVARDALWIRGLETRDVASLPDSAPTGDPGRVQPPAGSVSAPAGPPAVFGSEFDALLFVKGDNDLPNSQRTVEQADRWRQTYVVTDEGPSYRPGHNLYLLSPPRPDGKVTALTRFTDGYVGEPEISWDGTRVLFTRREQGSPWWHIWRMKVDGSNLEQLTHGPYHDVGPAFLPDGRIVFASSRSGIRDEYHGYLCTALYVMNADGSDLHPIATNIGRDNEPTLLADGRIVFSRLEVFYSRNKTELTLHAVHPDGSGDVVLYGPERRAFWRQLDHGPRAPDDDQEAPLTHRVLRMTQPQPMPDGRHIIVATQGGLALVGPSRDAERLICPDYKTRAYTTPLPLADGTVLCAATWKNPDRKQVDLALYRFDLRTGKLELIYNDPQTADYEPRPILARRPPPILSQTAQRGAYAGRLFCSSVFNTQEKEVRERGRLVRLIEGVPVVGRHATHTGPDEVWKNHGGTFARVLGMAPLAADGSFYLELPAERLVHLQVLDSDRRVLGNQLTWMSTRPGESKSCVGCHESASAAAPASYPGLAGRTSPLSFLPTGHEFTYRAKAWFKGSLPPEIEERTRTVRAVNLLAR